MKKKYIFLITNNLKHYLKYYLIIVKYTLCSLASYSSLSLPEIFNFNKILQIYLNSNMYIVYKCFA